MKSLLYILAIVSTLVTLSAACGCNSIQFVTRSEWKARKPKGRQCMATPVPHVFIHHTAEETCSDLASCSVVMRTMQNFHIDTRGWDDIGYTFVIGGDGRVYEGRGWTTVGAHVPWYNDKSTGISLMGNYMDHLPSPVMLNASRNLIACGLEQGYISTDYQLHGHRDGRCTLCPGDFLYNLIKTWPRFVGGKLPHYTC